MKRIVFCALLFLFGFFGFALAEGSPEQKDRLEVTAASICRSVVGLECMGAGRLFPAGVERLSCFSAVKGADGETFVTHVWYYKDLEVLQKKLPVRSAEWRTYSTKNIGPTQTGPWRVDIRGPSGESLKSVSFEIVP